MSEQNNGVEIPLDISYTDDDIAELSKRDRFVEGSYRFSVTGIQRQVSKDAGYLMLVPQLKALGDPEDSNSGVGQAMREYLCLPIRNPAWGDSLPENYKKASRAFVGKCASFLRACLGEDELPAGPRWDKEQNSFVYNGEPIEKDDMESCAKEANTALMDKLVELWKDDPTVLVGCAPYADLFYEEGNDFPRLKNYRAELGDAALVSGDNMFAAEPTTKVETKPVAKKNGKPVPKKAGRK